MKTQYEKEDGGPYRAERGFWLKTSKETGTLFLQPQRTEFASNLNVLGSRFFPETPGKSPSELPCCFWPLEEQRPPRPSDYRTVR